MEVELKAKRAVEAKLMEKLEATKIYGEEAKKSVEQERKRVEDERARTNKLKVRAVEENARTIKIVETRRSSQSSMFTKLFFRFKTTVSVLLVNK